MIKQLVFCLGKIATLVQDDHGAALVSREDRDIEIGAMGAESRMF